MKSQSGRLMRKAILRRSRHGFSKRRAGLRTGRIFLAGEKAASSFYLERDK